MNLNNDPKEVVVQLLRRSQCSIQVGAILLDNHGIFSWGWNHVGPDGYGTHAERHCIYRANWSRVPRSTLLVSTRRKRNNKVLNSRPCDDCAGLIRASKIGRVIYQDRDGWKEL